MRVVPVVLENTPDGFAQTLQKVAPLSRRLNIDLCDGLVASNLTVTVHQVLAEIKKDPDLSANKSWDFDLMVANHLPIIEELSQQKDLNINSVVVHQKYWQKNPGTNFDLGVALDLDDQIDMKIIKQVSLVQIMTVDLGFQGSPFQDEMLAKVTKLRTSGFEGQIMIDGGVNERTLPLILENRGLPDTVAVGSYLARANNPKENYKILESIINEHSF
jgi:pentose-5-phosphate-3-epimerase